MEQGKKEKNIIVRQIVHYSLIVVLAALAIVAFVMRAQTKAYFTGAPTASEAFNTVLGYVPNIIVTVQIIVLGVVINTLLGLMSKIGFGITDKGKTLVNIINSLLKWVIIIAFALWILSVWGVNTTTLLASAGILALVVGLGAQSLIADILAGIFIVLEGEYFVGDIVVIDGWRGTIKNIGIRTTQIEDANGDIKIINNSEIKAVINKTRKLSLAKCMVSVSTECELNAIEQQIAEHLASIRATIPALQGDIMYKGVEEISGGSMMLLYVANCYEEDLYQAQRELNRAFRVLTESLGIPGSAPQSIEYRK